MAPLRRRPGSRAFRLRAFTLIELLVVIAIIAILTAILLPVFATIRENARQGVSISNLKDIQQKMEQFKLDNHRYPDVLFGYSDGNGNMKGALGRAQAYDMANGTKTAAARFPGLYPAYIKDVEEFTDPNNIVNTGDAAKFTPLLAVNLIAPCNPANDEILSTGTTTPAGSSPCSNITTYGPGSTVPTTRAFYTADAYDSSPAALGTNQVSADTVAPLVRYETAREGTACTGTPPPVGCDTTVSATDPNYVNQLRWQNPPSNTVITTTTYHVKNADKVIVMFESGAVKKITGHDFSTLEGTAAAPTFWKVNAWPDNLKP